MTISPHVIRGPLVFTRPAWHALGADGISATLERVPKVTTCVVCGHLLLVAGQSASSISVHVLKPDHVITTVTMSHRRCSEPSLRLGAAAASLDPDTTHRWCGVAAGMAILAIELTAIVLARRHTRGPLEDALLALFTSNGLTPLPDAPWLARPGVAPEWSVEIAPDTVRLRDGQYLEYEMGSPPETSPAWSQLALRRAWTAVVVGRDLGITEHAPDVPRRLRAAAQRGELVGALMAARAAPVAPPGAASAALPGDLA